jgi:hypothetical protein
LNVNVPVAVLGRTEPEKVTVWPETEGLGEVWRVTVVDIVKV